MICILSTSLAGTDVTFHAATFRVVFPIQQPVPLGSHLGIKTIGGILPQAEDESAKMMTFDFDTAFVSLCQHNRQGAALRLRDGIRLTLPPPPPG
jgi:hypothetical protein